MRNGAYNPICAAWWVSGEVELNNALEVWAYVEEYILRRTVDLRAVKVTGTLAGPSKLATCRLTLESAEMGSGIHACRGVPRDH